MLLEALDEEGYIREDQVFLLYQSTLGKGVSEETAVAAMISIVGTEN